MVRFIQCRFLTFVKNQGRHIRIPRISSAGYLCDMNHDKRLVIIDNGHGRDTPGKRSPDGKHREYLWCREAAAMILERLTADMINGILLVPEDVDIPLRERCRRVNEIASSRPAILLSIHNNASGDGSSWHPARGWAAYVSPNASAQSHRLAAILYERAKAAGMTGNRATPATGYWQANLAICRDTICPAVLTENLFQDNREDVDILSSTEGTKALVDIHVGGIKEYLKI